MGFNFAKKKKLTKNYRVVIESNSLLKPLNLAEISKYWDLIYFLIVNGFKAGQKQTLLGYFWVVFDPAFSIVFYSLIFGQVAKIDTGDTPYLLFSSTAVVLWTFVSTAMNSSVASISSYSFLIQKVYFPRIFIPFIAVAISLPRFLINLVILELMLIAYGYYPSLDFLFIIPLLLIIILFATSFGLLLSTFTVQYRDLMKIWGYFMRFYMYTAPVVYPLSYIPDDYKFLYLLNPLAVSIENFRVALIGGDILLIEQFWSFIISLILVYVSSLVFRVKEPYIVDTL